MIVIDGSLGEGGGQILRTSLALALITGQSVHLRNIRAGRPKPGLQAQHLMSVRAAATIGRAQVVGASLQSSELIFEPGAIAAGNYRFAIGTAGATGVRCAARCPAHSTMSVASSHGVRRTARCQRIRERSDVPIVILTSRDGTDDVVHGFELGADDYIIKPFKTAELIARVESILRRVEGYKHRAAPPIVRVGELEIDEPRHRVSVRGQGVNLTPMEFELLYFLAANYGQVFDRETLFREVWGYDYVGETNLVDVCVRRLREKVEIEASRPHIIVTVRGVGYKLAEP